MKVILILAAAIFQCSTGDRIGRVDGRIVRGANALLGEHPYQALYQITTEDGFIWELCGGSIISPTFVLTAAHCLSETAIKHRVVVGIIHLYDITTYRQNIDVIQRILHPKYKITGQPGPEDIGLLKLAKAIKLNPVVKLIALPKAGVEPSGWAVMSGWGSISTGDTTSFPNRLQTATVPIMSYAECNVSVNKTMGGNSLDKNANVCTGPLATGISGCSGDSGGPLAQNGTVIGVFSWGPRRCGTAGAPTVFAKVSNYISFIKSNVPNLPSSI